MPLHNSVQFCNFIRKSSDDCRKILGGVFLQGLANINEDQFNSFSFED